jgi:23S rRNA (cytidine2498-2'-O)-methyltransferase
VFGAAYLAAPEFEQPLALELARKAIPVTAEHGRLLLSPAPPREAAWALDIWTGPRVLPAPSIGAAANALRGIQRNWAGYQAAHHRRASLIEERLPVVRSRPLHFPEPAPTAHLGGWTLLDTENLLASPAKTSPFPNGACLFQEDRVNPPSRAYLKFWEACMRMGLAPGPGETCLDLGAAPGGWSWAAASLGAQVIAVDKAPLAPSVLSLPNVTWLQDSAFALPPQPVDWLISDVIAYPARILALVRRWIDAGCARRIVCSIKFQGVADYAIADDFAAIPGARVAHLLHNKHELTLLWTGEPGDPWKF